MMKTHPLVYQNLQKHPKWEAHIFVQRESKKKVPRIDYFFSERPIIVIQKRLLLVDSIFNWLSVEF